MGRKALADVMVIVTAISMVMEGGSYYGNNDRSK